MQIKMISKSGIVPAYETPGSAGMDIRAYVKEPMTIEPGSRAMVPTGIFMEIEPGYEVQIRARSGLAIKRGISLANGVGTIDSDYRGEVKVCLINLGEEPFTVNNGDRIAQMIVAKYEKAEIAVVDDLNETVRGTGGFGHTGV